MDRAARRARRRGEPLPPPAPRARRGRDRGAGPVIIDIDDDDDGGAGGAAQEDALGARGGGETPLMPPGSVATRTRSRRTAMQAPVPAAEEPPPPPRQTRKRRREGTCEEAGGAGGEVGEASRSRSTSRGKRPAARSRRASGSAGAGRARKLKEAEPEPEAEAPSGVDWVEVPRFERSALGDDASGSEDGGSRLWFANATDQGDEEHGSAAAGDRTEKQSVSRHVKIVNADNNDGEEGNEDSGSRNPAIADSMNADVAPSEDDYDEDMLEEKLVGDLIRAYSNGGDLDANEVDLEAEDEMEFDDDNDNEGSMGDADEGSMSVPMHDSAKVETQDSVDHKTVVAAMRCPDSKEEMESKGEGAPSLNQGSLPIEILDSDEEVKVLNDGSNVLRRKPLVQAEIPVVSPCVAWRTRSLWGMKKDRLSYNSYFEVLSDEPKEDDDDTEVELDDEEGDSDEDDDNNGGCDEEAEEEEEEEKVEGVERRKHKNMIVGFKKKTRNVFDGPKKRSNESSDDEILDETVRCGYESVEDENPSPNIIQPLIFQKDGSESPVDNDISTQQQKGSRTWELERRKKLKLGMVKNHRLYERELDSDSNPSDSKQSRRNGFEGGRDRKIGGKRKYSASKSGKKSSSTMLKRQSLLKLLLDKMSNHEDADSSPFDQQIECNFKSMHPLVFAFGDDDPIPTDRPEQDAALDMLWGDFEFAVESENIGTYYDDEGQEESNMLDLALATITPCSRGKHEFIIDEQIGIKCKYCSLVNLEIRFVFPSVVSNFAEKPAWRNGSCLKNALMYHHLYEQAGNGDGQSQDLHPYGTVWDLIPGAITTMYQHQREAFEFMWTNLVGAIRLDELKHGPKPDVVGGCVICHAPGTGKTRLAIVFIQTYLKVFPDCRPVIIAPRGMLFAWDEEFKKWDVNVPFHILNTADYTGKEDGDICKLIKKQHRTEKLTRLVKLLSWNKGHGVLGISYGLYTKLTSEKPGCTEHNKVRSILLENPGLLVLDEGHTPRNERSVMWKTLGNVKTEKRIILSGTPFQNNFLELYNILCLVRPRFGEMFLSKSRGGRRQSVSKKQRDKFSDKYEKGVWASLTSNVTDDNAEKVRSILKPFVHIHNGNILRTLPGLRECVIVLKPLPLQKSIIRKVENVGSGNNFEHEYVISLASTHPSLVTAINMSDEEAALIDKPMLEKLRSNPYEGVKTRFVLEIVRLCEALKEKVLIFSQFIQPLELIKEHLRKFFKWRDGKEILQMDGKILPRYRQNSIEVFNNPESEARVLLASTRACCEGISLTGASRVVLLDVVWNPAVGRQAISRAFRIGQKKFVYTYNLITYGTGEGDKYDRQAEKDHLSKLVFTAEDDFNNVRNMLSKAEMDHCSKLISEDKVLEEMTYHDQLKGMFLKIHYPPTESNIVFTYNQIAPELN